MPRKQDRPDQEVELLPAFAAEQARPESERLTAGEADLAASEEAGTVRRQPAAWFEPDQPDPAAATSSPAAVGKPQPVTMFGATAGVAGTAAARPGADPRGRAGGRFRPGLHA